MQVAQGWSQGMNQDSGKSVFSPQQYFTMLNGTIVSDEGLTNGTPTNIKGNKLFITIPDIFNVTKINNTFTVGQSYSFDLTINGITTTAITGIFSNNQSLFQQIQNVILADFNLTPLNIQSFWNDNYVLLYSPLVNLTIVSGGADAIDVAVASNFVNAQSGLFIIGWGTIREDIYLFTTNEVNAVPIASAGQIWKLTYNKSTLVPTLELKYNNILNFTVQHPIPNPGGIVGRYETQGIQRLYWTDNFNPLRSLNLADPMVFATDISLVQAQAAADFDIPILQKVSLGGSQVPVGIYQLAYRLKTTNGSITTFSEPSNLVSIVPQDEGITTGGGNYPTYVGADQFTMTTKQITWNIHNIDVDYDRIEACIIIKESLVGVPRYEIFLDEPINGSSKSITYGGQEPIFTLTQDEFTSLSSAFTHCKTIASKDNYLFAGNVRHVLEDINYDARAYRFPNSSASTTVDGTGGFTLTTALTYPETADSINNFPFYPSELTGGTEQVYQSGSTLFGGSGNFVSYEFGTLAVRTDTHPTFPTCWEGTNPGAFRRTEQEYDTDNINLGVFEQDNTLQSYPMDHINAGTKFVYYSSSIKDYQRGETYRFGIQLFDKSKNPYFVKWIGDIKFPNPADNDNNPGNHLYMSGLPQPFTDYRLTFTDTNTLGQLIAYTKHLFIKFNVTIPNNLINQISGYTIVRVKREVKDRTILGTGILNSVQVSGPNLGVAGTELFLPETGVGGPNYAFNAGADSTVNGGDGRATCFTFECPEFKIGGYPGYQSGDKLVVTELLNMTSEEAIDHCNATIPLNERFHMIKWYDNQALPALASHSYRVDKTAELQMAYSYILQGTFAGGYTYHNYTREFNGGNWQQGDCVSLGIRTLITELLDPLLAVTDYFCTLVSHNKILATYTRVNNNQYGGNSYAQRSFNEYISCMGYRPINNLSTNSFTDNIQVFNGDCFTTIYDEQRAIKCWTTEQGSNSTPSFTLPPNGSAESYSTFYPTQATCNVDLRHGFHPNASPLPNTGLSGADIEETYDYNITYGAENISRFYFPKPTQVVNTTELDNRIYNSDFKVNGELQDSWRVFKEDNHIDVDGNFGPLINLINFNNLLYFWQDYAFGSPAVNSRDLIQGSDGSSLTLGTGGILNRFDYISTTIGSKHQFSFIIGRNSLAWLDITKKRFYKFGANGTQELQGLNGYFNTHLIGSILVNDNPYTSKGCTGTYDYRKNEFIFTCLGTGRPNNNPSFTVGYLDRPDIQGFHSFYSFNPGVYVNDVYNIFSSLPVETFAVNEGKLWLHNEGNYGVFYDTLYPFIVTSIINPNPELEKVFDSFRVETEALTNSGVVDDTNFVIDNRETFDQYMCWTDYSNTGLIPIFQDTASEVKRGWNIKIVGNQVMYLNPPGNLNILDPNNIFTYPNRKPITERLKAPYFFLQLNYSNLQNHKFTLQTLVSNLRLNERSTFRT